jgi:hypothetical protein
VGSAADIAAVAAAAADDNTLAALSTEAGPHRFTYAAAITDPGRRHLAFSELGGDPDTWSRWAREHTAVVDAKDWCAYASGVDPVEFVHAVVATGLGAAPVTRDAVTAALDSAPTTCADVLFSVDGIVDTVLALDHPRWGHEAVLRWAARPRTGRDGAYWDAALAAALAEPTHPCAEAALVACVRLGVGSRSLRVLVDAVTELRDGGHVELAERLDRWPIDSPTATVSSGSNTSSVTGWEPPPPQTGSSTGTTATFTWSHGPAATATDTYRRASQGSADDVEELLGERVWHPTFASTVAVVVENHHVDDDRLALLCSNNTHLAAVVAENLPRRHRISVELAAHVAHLLEPADEFVDTLVQLSELTGEPDVFWDRWLHLGGHAAVRVNVAHQLGYDAVRHLPVEQLADASAGVLRGAGALLAAAAGADPARWALLGELADGFPGTVAELADTVSISG